MLAVWKGRVDHIGAIYFVLHMRLFAFCLGLYSENVRGSSLDSIIRYSVLWTDGIVILGDRHSATGYMRHDMIAVSGRVGLRPGIAKHRLRMSLQKPVGYALGRSDFIPSWTYVPCWKCTIRSHMSRN